jgi:predicted Abi (CAAX) family protease
VSDPIKSSYELFLQAPFNRPEHYPLVQPISPELYRPLATWMGRLIAPKPEQRNTVKGILFEVHHAAAEHQHLVGKVVYLRWSDRPDVQARVWSVARDVYFSKEAIKGMREGLIHPTRSRRWRLVTSLESLAGARPNDDVIVKLREPVEVVEPQQDGEPISLYINREPVQVTGRYYGLVTFLEATKEDLFRVAHFNRDSRQFDGTEEVVRLPETIKDNVGLSRSTSRGIENDSVNATGWYISGAKGQDGVFVVQAMAPRALLRLEPERTISGQQAAIHYVKKESWRDATKGQISSVLLTPQKGDAVSEWLEGDEAVLVNTYGGIGNGREPYPYPGGYYFGHFSYGRGRVIREPLADELSFELDYFQVFASNGDGLIPGVLHWTRYIGDRQFGYLGYRPVCDILIKLDCFTEPYHLEDRDVSALDQLTVLLETTLHTYRIGGGAGGVFFGVANNCTQDSNQALYSAVQILDTAFKEHPLVQEMLKNHPQEGERFDRLLMLGQSLKKTLLPFGATRGDWQYNFHLVDTSLNEPAWINILRALSSWRTMTPHWASNAVTEVFLKHGASVWVLRANQIGNYDPDIVPKAIDP